METIYQHNSKSEFCMKSISRQDSEAILFNFILVCFLFFFSYPLILYENHF